MGRPSPRGEEAKRLRHEEGLTYQEIGARMGITRQGAHLLVNPEHSREYKKSRYRAKINVEERKEI